MIGIDFGTTNSAIAHALQEREATPIHDPISKEKILPSVVYYETPERIIVGQQAKNRFYEIIGQPNSHIFRSIKRRLKDDRTYNIFGKPVHETEIASHIFANLKKRAEKIREEEVSSAVVTIPVYFDADQRKTIRKAAKLGGIEINGFLHEPVAAVYQYCHHINYTQYILVVDWGGGTLDISVLKVDNGMISELEVGGDENLGGDDIDQNIAKNVFTKFISKQNISPFDLKSFPVSHQRLINMSEVAKIDLSDPEEHEATIDILNFYQNNDLSFVINRVGFETINEEIFKRVMKKIQDTLDKLKLSPNDIDQVVLAGGSSRIPYLIRKIESIFGAVKIRTMQNAATCVAEGAALMSYRGFDPILSIPIGIELNNGYIHTFIEKGESLKNPYEDEITLSVTDPREGIANIKIFESESGDPNAHDSRLKDILTVPINNDILEQIRMQFSVDNHQCLIIRAVGLQTGIEKKCKIKDIKMGFKL